MAATVATPLERALGRIAGVTEMTSSSSLGSTNITLQFDLSRNIDGAARDVQAAINAARSLLPTGLPSNPNYRKVNPADAPVMILALTSATYDKAHMYDVGSSILQQKLSPNTATDPAQQRMLQFMPLVFGFMMINLPAGLTLYMLTNALTSIVQQLILNKKLNIEPGTPAVVAGAR